MPRDRASHRDLLDRRRSTMIADCLECNVYLTEEEPRTSPESVLRRFVAGASPLHALKILYGEIYKIRCLQG